MVGPDHPVNPQWRNIGHAEALHPPKARFGARKSPH
jgi:hypothetical protein